MAPFLTTFKLIINFFWAVAKHTLVLIITSWLLYFVEFNENIKSFLSANIFAINIIFIYFLFKKDRYLELNRFYLLFNISRVSVFLSKLALLGIPFFLHFSLFLIVIMQIEFHLYITLVSILILTILSKLIFYNIEEIWSAVVYCFLLTILFLVGYIISDVLTTLLMLCLSLLCLWLVIYHIFKMMQIAEDGGTY